MSSLRTQKPAMSGFESLLLFFVLSIPSTQAWPIDYPSPIANLPSFWTNNNASIPYNATYNDGTLIRAILVRQNPAGFGPSFACGFICNAPCNVFQFAVFFISIGDSNNLAFNAMARPRVVWTANRLRPVKENASVELTKDGNLILRDFDGSLVWSTNTSGSPVVGMNLAETGNLILFNVMGKTVWESFEYPTDTLLIGQSLKQGQRLTSTSMVTNRTQGQFYLTVLNNGMYAFIDADPPQLYYQEMFNITEAMAQSKMNISCAQLMSLEDDGHLRIYGWTGNSWKSLADVLHVHPDECAYPTVCEAYYFPHPSTLARIAIPSTQTSSRSLTTLGQSAKCPMKFNNYLLNFERLTLARTPRLREYHGLVGREKPGRCWLPGRAFRRTGVSTRLQPDLALACATTPSSRRPPDACRRDSPAPAAVRPSPRLACARCLSSAASPHPQEP
ncbi:hypothetical protein PR202_ga06994 [Eleusine coracana subsp. coracana]|uniref:non-specific serine/threonine protein kinase n=1 Tax=Eleusine coracana subsp. coracana TaxID=191504 RepID=A0AAV5BWF8_ELECO|nr:hypothetical protein PR202_ga06994 [Eleusine coracana subsp. coracana]